MWDGCGMQAANIKLGEWGKFGKYNKGIGRSKWGHENALMDMIKENQKRCYMFIKGNGKWEIRETIQPLRNQRGHTVYV